MSKVSAQVEFGDELQEMIEEVVASAIDDVDFSDKLSDALGYGNDPTDHYDMSDYVTTDSADMPTQEDMREAERAIEDLSDRVATLERTLQQVAGLLMGTMTATPTATLPSPTQG
jgi:hypothetical protein